MGLTKAPYMRGPERLAEVLRASRRQAGLSQLELALRLGISQRHLSFVEIGRARPSRDLLMSWMTALDAPISLCNAALLHAGYPTLRNSAKSLEADEMFRGALEELVGGHELCPAIIFDADWFAVSANAGARRLFELLAPNLPVDISDGPRGFDIIASVGHRDGLLSRAENPEHIASALLNQFELEAWARPELRERTRECGIHLRARYVLPSSASQDISVPHLKLTFNVDGQSLRFFTVQAVFSLPQNVNPDVVRAGLWFPEDSATRCFLANEASTPDTEDQ